MAEKSIILPTEMVKAAYEDRKSQIRLVIKSQPTLDWHYQTWWDKSTWAWTTCHPLNVKYPNQIHKVKCPYQPGDIIWVQESLWISECGRYFAQQILELPQPAYDIIDRNTYKRWKWRRYRPVGFDDKDIRYTHPEFKSMVGGYHNRGRTLRSGRDIEAFDLSFSDMDKSMRIEPFTGNAILANYSAEFRKRYSPRFMPREVAQLLLVVKDVRVERLQEISEEDARAEGIIERHDKPWPDGDPGYIDNVARRAFARFWNSTNGKKYSWESNPRVRVITFERRQVSETAA